MADSAETVEEEKAAEEPKIYSDTSIASLFDVNEDEIEEDSKEGEPTPVPEVKVPAVETPVEPVVEPSPTEDPQMVLLREQNLALQQTVAALQQQNAQPSNREEASEEAQIDYEALNTQMQQDPGRTTVNIVEDAVQRALGKFSQDVDGKMESRQQMAAAQESDKQRTITRFGKIMESTPELMQRANRIYDDAVRLNGGTAAPGMVYASVSTAHSDLVLEGKLQPALTPKPTRAPKTDLGTRPEERPTPDDGLDNMYKNPQELMLAKEKAQEMGVPWTRWVKWVKKGMQEDPSYGRA